MENVLEDLGDAEVRDDSRVNTPVTSPLPDSELRQNVSKESVESSEVDSNQNKVHENDFTGGFDAELGVREVENNSELSVK